MLELIRLILVYQYIYNIQYNLYNKDARIVKLLYYNCR